MVSPSHAPNFPRVRVMGLREEGSGEGVSGEGERGVGVMGGQDGSWMDKASEFIDDHLRLFRTVPWILGGLGALLLLRHSTVVSLQHMQTYIHIIVMYTCAYMP